MIAVWGGEPDCAHVWGEKIVQRQRGTAHGAGAQCGNTLAEIAPTVAEQGAYCSLCGAWRGQLGLEPTWQEYIAHLCECAKEWWRVLKPTGNLFVNMGDTFTGSWGNMSHLPARDYPEGRPPQSAPGMTPKNKLGIPYRLRFALNDMGWVSRDDIPWVKGKLYPDGVYSKTAMPESVKGRFACSYEMVMRFVKTPKMNYYVNERTLESRDRPPSPQVEDIDFKWVPHRRCNGTGFVELEDGTMEPCGMAICHDGMVKSTFWHGVDQWFDLDAVRRPIKTESIARYQRGVNLVERTGAAMTPANKFWDKEDLERHGGAGTLRGRTYRAKTADESSFKPPGSLRQAPEPGEPHAFHPAGANPGDVWIIQPEPFSLKHYAVWPSELCERMIKVGCPKEVCPKCGKPRERISESHTTYESRWGKQGLTPEDVKDKGKYGETDKALDGDRKRAKHDIRLGPTPHVITIGWSDCGCGKGFVPGVVLDPFGGGSARLPKEARKLGRNAIIVDLKEEYLEMTKGCLIYGEKGWGKEKERRELGMKQETLL